jgi:integrase
MTVAEMGELFLREGLEGRGEHWAGAVRQAFRNHIGPVLGERLAHEVESADIDALFRTVAQGGTASGGASQVRGGPEAANAAQASISAAFSFAVRCAIVPDSPARGVRRFVGRRVERFLTPEEYRRLGRVMAIADAFSSVNPSALALVRLVLLTGVSPGHALQLDRAHFQPNLRRLRFVAGGRERIVWLGWRALSLVNRLAAEAGEGPLFPGRGGRGRLSDVQPVWERLRVAAGIADVRLIDLRHSFAARAIATGENPRVVGRLLTHAAAGTMERYPTVPDAPVKAAAERISGEIAELLGAPLGGAAAWRREAPEADPQVTALLAAAPQARCLDLDAAARRAGLTPRTLVVYRDDGIGPPYRRVGGRVVYPEAELDLWIERRGGRRAARTRRRP